MTLALLSADQSFLANFPNSCACRRNSKILPGMEAHYRELTDAVIRRLFNFFSIAF